MKLKNVHYSICGRPETPLEIAKRHHKDYVILSQIADILAEYEFFDEELDAWADELIYHSLDEKIQISKDKANAFYAKVTNLKPKRK